MDERTTRTEAAHLASSTLVWSVGEVTLRLEGTFTREQALAAARASLPPS